MSEQKRAVIYARFSSAGQREESIEGQIRECSEYARRQGYVIAGNYIDRALTGTNDKRPDFQRMIRDSARGTFDVVICWKHDRFARNRYDAAIYKVRLKQAGVKIEYAVESVPEGPEGIILDSVMEGYAEYYSANLAQNVRRGIFESASKRQTVGVEVFGYRKGADGRFEIEPTEAEAVRKIFDDYVAGRSAKEITDELNALGVRSRWGNELDRNTVVRIIKNPKYKGVYSFAEIYDPEGIPPIVDPEIWAAAQKRVEDHRRAPSRRHDDEDGYLLAGKLYCGECESRMISASGTSASGREYKYYACEGHKKKKNDCKMKQVDKDWIEENVVAALAEIVHSDAILDEYVERYLKWQDEQRAESSVTALEKRVREIDAAEKNIVRAVEQGLNTPAFYERLKQLSEERLGIKERIARALVDDPQLSESEVRWFLERFRSGSVESPAWRINVVENFLQRAYLFGDGRLVLVLNHTGPHNRLTLDLIKSPPPGSLVRSSHELDSQEVRNRTIDVYFVNGLMFVGLILQKRK